jgi:hypothetical protein
MGGTLFFLDVTYRYWYIRPFCDDLLQNPGNLIWNDVTNLRLKTRVVNLDSDNGLVSGPRNMNISVVDPKLFIFNRIRIPFSSEFWIRILFDLQKVPDPTLNIHSFTMPKIFKGFFHGILKHPFQ